jgi:uncharacterized repeat protein (TIGR04138 family)
MFDPSQPLAQLLREDRRYRFEAYVFVFEALSYAHNTLRMGTEAASEPAEKVGGEEDEGPQRHVTGQELCEAVRKYAVDQYGLMAKTVLNHWGIRSTSDLGEIVFNLIRIGRMRKTSQDRRDDFDDVYDFETAFQQQFSARPQQ